MDDYGKIRALKNLINKRTILRLAMSLLLALLAGWWSIPYAKAARGYFAIGGEYCLIMIMGALPWFFQSVISGLKEIVYLCNCKEQIDE